MNKMDRERIGISKLGMVKMEHIIEKNKMQIILGLKNG